MVVATINWALLLITESISLLDLCKYANAMLIHTSNYVPCNMWQSGTLSLWLTGKSVGSVKNLSSDSDLKWLCRETIMNEDRAACLRLLSSTSSHVCVSFCWNVLKVCSLSFLSVSPRTRKAYANWIVPPGVFGNGVHHAVFAVSDPAQSQDCWNPEKATYFQLQTSVLLFSANSLRVCIYCMVLIYKILHLPDNVGIFVHISDVRLSLLQWINSIPETFTAP